MLQRPITLALPSVIEIHDFKATILEKAALTFWQDNPGKEITDFADDFSIYTSGGVAVEAGNAVAAFCDKTDKENGNSQSKALKLTFSLSFPKSKELQEHREAMADAQYCTLNPQTEMHALSVPGDDKSKCSAFYRRSPKKSKVCLIMQIQ